MTDLNTADDIFHRPTKTYTKVACRHDDYIYTCEAPSRNLRVDECDLVKKASESDRLDLMRKMAASESNQHRPVCARSRLAEMAEAYDGGGYE